MRIIINADDLGISQEVNDAIFGLMAEGRITSATVLANGPAVEDAAKRLAEFPKCSFGVHLNLTQFKAISSAPGLKPIVDRDGDFAGNIRAVPLTPGLREQLVGRAGSPNTPRDGRRARRSRPAMRTVVKPFELLFKSLFLFAWLRRCRSGTVLLRLRG